MEVARVMCVVVKFFRGRGGGQVSPLTEERRWGRGVMKTFRGSILPASPVCKSAGKLECAFLQSINVYRSAFNS